MITEFLLSNYRSRFHLDQRIVLLGNLKHRHHSGQMQSYYCLSEQGQYGYAYVSEAPSIPSYEINQPVLDLIQNYKNISLKLALLDAVWKNESTYASKIALTGPTPLERAKQRTDAIVLYLRQHSHARKVVMLGYFQLLAEQLREAGFTVHCCDADIQMKFSISLQDLKTLMPESNLLVSASYLTRDDYPATLEYVKQAAFSVLLSQTCSHMIEFHQDMGFDVVFSETFPPYSLANSSMKIYQS